MRHDQEGIMAEERTRRILLRDLNEALICALCNGYLVDATALVECLHVFCRGCILRHFETSKAECPSCKTACRNRKNHGQSCVRADSQIQALVYKVVPGLYSREMQRREDFYRSTGVRAGSSCSDDSVLERERDLIINDQEAQIAAHVGDKNQFFGPEDLISLSLEYYQWHLDSTPLPGDKATVTMTTTTPMTTSSTSTTSSKSDKTGDDAINEQTKQKSEPLVVNATKQKLVNGAKIADASTVTPSDDVKDDKSDAQCSNNNNNDVRDRRFLQCPAGVTMRHLQKFLRKKNALSANHRVDIIHEGEVLPVHFSLMDVAYCFKWQRAKPMRFFYRIFTPLKIQPIRIVKTSLSTGGKQLQVVSRGGVELLPPPPPPPLTQPPAISSLPVGAKLCPFEQDMTRKESEEKERLLSNLQLQSRTKSMRESVFDYGEPDKDEEIKKFAETRDREWAMMQQQKRLDADDHRHHVSRKRKKSKHSKDFVHKKRKLHAEITNNKEAELKLKVKLTNGHKHKHHKSSTEIAAKEKLLQMRQVRHEKKKIDSNGEIAKNSDSNNKPKPGLGVRVPTVQLERNEQTEQQAKKTFLTKTYHHQGNMLFVPNDSVNKLEKPKPSLPAFSQHKTLTSSQVKTLVASGNTQLERKIANLQQRCTIETKPSTQQQQETTRKEVARGNPSCPPGFTVSKIESNPGGVKRKVEPVKSDDVKDKRPSLEITLINPNNNNGEQSANKTVKRPPPATIPLERIKKCINSKSGLSIISKLGENRCDNIGALDLSAKPSVLNSKISDPTLSVKQQPQQQRPLQKPALKVYGMAPGNANNNNLKEPSPGNKTANLSNLQMLSKVATEHPNLNNKVTPSVVKVRPQLPSLQTLKIPSPQQPHQQHQQQQQQASGVVRATPNVPKLIPKLTEINKSNYRFGVGPPIRNLRPNQNQNIRNIPNPSLLVRQQNQNRLNSLNSVAMAAVAVTTASTTTATAAVASKVAVGVAKPEPDRSISVASATPIKKEVVLVMASTTTTTATTCSSAVVATSGKVGEQTPKRVEEKPKLAEATKEG